MPRGPHGKLTIVPELRTVYLNLIRCGLGYEKAAAITDISTATWSRLAKSDAEFGEARAKARATNGTIWADALLRTALEKVREGHPYWARWVMHNFPTGFHDPDDGVPRLAVDYTQATLAIEYIPCRRLEGGNGNGHGNRIGEIVAEQETDSTP